MTLPYGFDERLHRLEQDQKKLAGHDAALKSLLSELTDRVSELTRKCDYLARKIDDFENPWHETTDVKELRGRLDRVTRRRAITIPVAVSSGAVLYAALDVLRSLLAHWRP